MTLEKMIGILEKCKVEEPNATIVYEDETSTYTIDQIVIDFGTEPATVIFRGGYLR